MKQVRLCVVLVGALAFVGPASSARASICTEDPYHTTCNVSVPGTPGPGTWTPDGRESNVADSTAPDGDGSAVRFDQTGTITGTDVVPVSGPSFSIWVKGEPPCPFPNVPQVLLYPHVQVRIDSGAYLIDADVGPAWTQLVARWQDIGGAYAVDAGSHTITITGTSPACTPTTGHAWVDNVSWARFRPFDSPPAGSPPTATNLWWQSAQTRSSGSGGYIDPDSGSNRFLGDFVRNDGSFEGLQLSGLPNQGYGVPEWFTKMGDPFLNDSAINLRLTCWSTYPPYDHNGLWIPNSAQPEQPSGSDGHMAVVDPFRAYAWETIKTYAGQCGQTSDHDTVVTLDPTTHNPVSLDAGTMVKWNLNSPGFNPTNPTGSVTSARGSGTPLIITTLRADEPHFGPINHALGITLARSDKVEAHPCWTYPPASHSDGAAPCSTNHAHVRYGDLFVLRSNFPTTGYTAAQINVINALKTYGAYVVDKGGNDFEIDVSSNDPGEFWNADSFTQNTFATTNSGRTPLMPADFRYVCAAQSAGTCPAR